MSTAPELRKRAGDADAAAATNGDVSPKVNEVTVPASELGPQDAKKPEWTKDGRLQDYLWVGYPEPHAARRVAMLKKYPQIKRLMRHEPVTKYYVFVLVAIQLYAAYYVGTNPDIMWTWRFWALAYLVGGTTTNSLVLAIHEVTHFLAFKEPLYNKLLACVANLPIVFPYCVEFKKYHMDHHRFQGVDGVDGDIPTEIEAQLMDSFPGKLFFLIFQILFYALRPVLAATPVAYKTPLDWYAFSVGVQGTAMFLVLRYWGLNSIIYMLFSIFFGGSLHPMAGHFVAEHFVTELDGRFETYSYYGPWNVLTFNVGYHNEHHDFANVPWTLLPELRKIAPEFYEPLPKVSSWPGMMYRFLTDPKVGMKARVKRMNRGGALGWRGMQGQVLPEELPVE